jgi:mRNA interferase RelE/StbE
MPTYRIEFTSRALRELDRLSADIRQRAVARAEALSPDPRPPGAKKLTRYASRYRIRVGEYRIVYEIRDQVLVVLVLTVGHRKSVYKEG